MLLIHRAERADPLAAALAMVLRDRLDDPFAAETVAVPSRGVERWLSQRLSLALGTTAGRADGVCANVEFPFPGRLLGGAIARATGVDRDRDPWLPERSVWPLLEVVDDHLDAGWLGPLAGHLRAEGADDGRPHRRFAPIRHLADLFDHYAVHRPAMIRAWAAGTDVGANGRDLPRDVVWQAALWRHLRERIATESPAERWERGCRRLQDSPDLLDQPSRLALFGLTRLPVTYVDALQAVAAHREVHLFLLHPAPDLWDRIASLPTRPKTMQSRSTDPTARLPRHPLLDRWGQDAREMQLVLLADGHEDLHHHLEDRDLPATLLRRIQDDVRHDRELSGSPLPGHHDERLLIDDDRSLQVHACHGRARQVEVLRDAVLHLLADDPTLQPRDIIVMCPDIDAYSPLIHATFGARVVDDPDDDPSADDGLPGLTVRLADRSLRQTNPVLGCLAELLAMTESRITASEVIDFASREPVKRRFRFDDDDVTRIEEWVREAGVRWGIDAPHREPYKLAGLTANTWRAGLDRLLLGTAMDENGLRLFSGVLPLDDVDSGDIDLAGRLAELVDRVGAAIDDLSQTKTIDAWMRSLQRAMGDLTTTTERDGWQWAQFERILDEVRDEAGTGTDRATILSLADVRSLLADRLRGRPTRANFRTGHLTMCTLVPMRSVPHRVVCVLGLDDGVFPRRTAPDGDDLLQRAPCVGDRDARSEDRQLLLDALLAATERVVITFSGRDDRTNAIQPPAVPLGELLDVVDATARTGDGRPARERVVVHHPLQPFDERNFASGALVHDRHWSFDRTLLAGAKAAAGPRTGPQPFLTEPLEPVPGAVIELEDLVSFAQHPVRAFLRQRLGVGVRELDDDPSDGLPVELDHLEMWEVGQRLLEARLAGAAASECWLAELARGALPPDELGREVLDAVSPKVERIVEVFHELTGPDQSRSSVTVSIELPDGRSLVGTVANTIGTTLASVTYSRLGPKHRMAAWVRLLSASAAHGELGLRSITIGRGGYGRVGVSTIEPVNASDALDQLALLVDLYDRGMCEPVPIYGKTSAAWAEAVAAGDRPEGKARKEWSTGPGSAWDMEDRELVHQLVHGEVLPFAQLIEDRPRVGEHGPMWPGDESTRFGRYARRLWDGLLAAEKLSSR